MQTNPDPQLNGGLPRSEQIDPNLGETADHNEIPVGIRQSQEAFRRDLPQLLQIKKLFRRWVAYQGDKRVAIARSETALYDACFQRGLKEEEFVVRCIVPEIPGNVDTTPLFDV